MKAVGNIRGPVLVHPVTPVDIKREELDDLIERLHFEGLDARPARIEGEGVGVDHWWDIVAIWVGLEVSRAVINQIVRLGLEWAKERFQRAPESRQRRKGVRLTIVQYHGNEGRAVEIVELEAEDADPVRRPPEGVERSPRFRPPERVAREPAAPANDIEQELPTLTLPALTGKEEDLLWENRERLYEKARLYPIEAVLDGWLLIEAGAHTAAIRNNIAFSAGITQILRTLADHKRIPELVVDATHTLKRLRSKVAPRQHPGLPTATAIAYIDTVVRVIVYLARA